MVQHHTGDSFIKIVYAKVRTNGRIEMVPLKLHVDGSIEHISETIRATNAPQESFQALLGGRYQIQRVLGQGGFGRTYLAIDRHRFDERCVIKEFLPQQTGDYESRKSRDLFEREAQILHRLEHPQIPQFFACFEQEEKLFLAQEYVEGKTYSDLLRERRQQGYTFSEVEVVRWLKDLLPVLDYIHQNQIIHRDISPDNIMLQQGSNMPILIDFGVGKWAAGQSYRDAASLQLTSQGSVVGKLGYAPHEQIWMGECSPSSDLYSLAVTAIVLLTGKDPQQIMQSPNSPYASQHRWQDHIAVNGRLGQILHRMLQDHPTDRYSSAQAVLDELEALDRPDAPCRTEISAPIQESVTVVSQPAPMPLSQPPQQSPAAVKALDRHGYVEAINQALLDHYQRELVTCIGPVAKFLIQETLSQHAHLSPERLVTVLAERIPNPEQATEFRRRILRH
jgi:serine/threonine-protein kinase